MFLKDRERIEIMARHYIIAALWADSEEGTNPRATKSAMEKAKADCWIFCEKAGPELLREVQRRHADGYGKHPDCGTVHPEFAAMGHDFWLTRNGHGVGFWDRDELERDGLGDKLTAICKEMREANYEFYRGWLYLN